MAVLLSYNLVLQYIIYNPSPFSYHLDFITILPAPLPKLPLPDMMVSSRSN